MNQQEAELSSDLLLTFDVLLTSDPLTSQVSQWVPSANGSSDVLGFIQWKPVAYRRSNPALEDATPCRHSDPRPQRGEATAAASALIRAFYTEPETFGLNVSFGLAGEPFYNSTKFLSWSVYVNKLIVLY